MSVRLVADEPGHIRVEGELDFASASAARDELQRHIAAAASSVCLDFAGVTRVNSVGLSLVLVAARAAQQQGTSLSVQNLPAGLRSMAQVCGLDQWLASIAAPATAG